MHERRASSARLAAMAVLPLEHVLEGSLQLVGRAMNGLLQRRRVVLHRRRLPTLEARFHHAALVLVADLLGALVADVNLDARDPIAETIEGVLDHTSDVLGESLVGRDVMIRLELNLHLLRLCVTDVLQAMSRVRVSHRSAIPSRSERANVLVARESFQPSGRIGAHERLGSPEHPASSEREHAGRRAEW